MLLMKYVHIYVYIYTYICVYTFSTTLVITIEKPLIKMIKNISRYRPPDKRAPRL
uniref:Hypothetical secreted peptide n=1 Tax=Glossina morsitans morsitans TaxID=37546 RepID=D3TSJ8_GLOMM